MPNSSKHSDYAVTAELYDYLPVVGQRDDFDFWVELALQSGGPVLELGCGTGRILLPIARAGIPITGLDPSEHMLAVCKQRLDDEPKELRDRVSLVQADMSQLSLNRKFQLITTPFRSFQHLTTVDDQLRCLHAIHDHLEEGGRFVLDVYNPSIKFMANEPIDEEYGDFPEITMPDGRMITVRALTRKRDFATQTQDAEMVYYVTHPGGKKERLTHRIELRFLYRYEAEHLLARCGFEVEAVYGDFDKSPFGSKDPGELIVIARK